MKKVLFLMAAVLVMASCGSKKTAVKGEVEVNVPCSEFKTDKNTLRASGNAISPNMQNAKDKAVSAARRELATSIEATMQRVLEDFSSSYDLDNQADFRARTKDLARTVVNQKLQGSVIVCDKMMKKEDKDGVMYHAYVAVELTTNELMEALLNNTKKKISDSEKLRTDFEYEQFKKTFEEEMSKLAGQQ